MAYFAELDSNNKVLRVVSVSNFKCMDVHGNEVLDLGAEFCKTLFGENTSWRQTSFNKNFRKNYAGIGYSYDENLDAFIPPKPYPSWLLDEKTCQWNAPIPYPSDGNSYRWDEDSLNWLPSDEPIS